MDHVPGPSTTSMTSNMSPSRGSRSVPSAEDWENKRSTIHKLYVVDKKPLKDVKTLVEASDAYFHATYGAHLLSPLSS